MNIFKAYDVRGRYPDEINEEVVARIARGLAAHWSKSQVANRKSQQITIVVGHDARLSSPALYKAVQDSFEVRSSKFLVVMPVGLITTPMLYFLVNHHKAAGGIMVTASHNPPDWNGIKAVREQAMPISGKELQRLVSRQK